MDITGEFRRLVQQQTSKHEAQAGRGEKDTRRRDILPPRRPDFSHPNNVYLSEAYIIAKHLRALHHRIVSLRPSYLNLQSKNRRTSKLSDPERDEIDRSIKTTIRQMLSKIQALSELGEQILENEDNDEPSDAKVLFKRLVGALDPRLAGGKPVASGRDMVAAHQSSVAWWLNVRLQRTNKTHGDMQELYLKQKLERQRGMVSAQTFSRKPAEDHRKREDDPVLSHLSEQELQQLQVENNSLMMEFESAMDKITETQRSLLEISALQTQLANELSAQTQMTERLYSEAVGTVDAVDKGNEFLISARKHQSTARKWVLTVFIVLSLVLLFLDWFD
ncbi:hypothetical protein FBU59_004592 [Linderina macrospora]|uniref:Uncharacterized protein n=1 Tax=Linderina macrospora TaxID=4868 RepID=A0ACC1J592_9FUNG|nr:hypothetical protein FBU59_004592 [Linderina macrospora]